MHPHSRFISAFSVVAVVGASALASFVGMVSSPLAQAYTAPTVVNDVSANAVGSGQLFGGRNEAMAVNPANPQIVLAAIELGGVWRSTDGGGHWTHVDGLPLTSMDDVQFAASDPNLVVATGEYDGSSATKNAEVYVSSDGGSSWVRAATLGCGTNARSAHKLAIGAGTPGSLPIFVATDCGLVRSGDSGATWTNVSPAGASDQFWDVKIRGSAPNYTVDTCDANGSFYRSVDGGGVFTATAGALAGGFLPCRIATAPGNANVVFLASFSVNPSPVDALCMGQLFESDNGGGTFTNLNPTQDGNCRPANVITTPAFNGGPANQFEVFFATDSNWLHQTCDLNNLPGSTACAVGNGNNGGSFSDWDSSIQAVHNAPDSSDIAFGSNGCPFLSSGDGGIFATSDGCAGTPSFATSNVGLHGLQATANAGSSYTGHTDLYFSTQDNGIWNTGNAGASWNEQGPDVYGVFADQDGPPSQVIYKECCFISGGQATSKLFTDNESLSSQGTLSPPPGNQPAFGNILGAQFGYQSYALLTSDSTPTWRVYVTTNNGGTWTQMGPDLPAGSNPLQLLASGPPASPTFYLLNRVGGTGTLSRLTGPFNSSATFTPLGSGLSDPGRIAASPTNPLLLYAQDKGGTPAMKRSTNGGASFTTDASLTSLVTAGGEYRLISNVTAMSIDGNSSTVLVGTVDNGILASTNGGLVWAKLRGSSQISRPTGFFFDEKTGKAYTASAGRAEWQISLPHADLSVTKTHFPDPAVAGSQLTWQVTVTNNGPDPAPDVVVTDTLPPQVDYLTNNLNPPNGCTATGQVVTCSIGDLAAGDSATFKLVTLVHSDTVAIAGGPTGITNTATVTSPEVIDPDPSNDTVKDTALVNDSADLAASKLCKPDTLIYAGTPINCSVFIDNSGPSWARSTALNDTILSNGPFTISPVSISPNVGSCALTTVTGGQKLACTLGDLAPASTTATGRVTVSYTLTATEGQDINNVAAVSATTPDPDLTNNKATVSLTVSALADLSLTKTGPASVVAGTAVEWDLQASNSGPSTAVNGVISDSVPAGVTITSVQMPGATCKAGVPGDSTRPTTCAFASLASGATTPTMAIKATVNPRTTGILHNDASVSSDTFDTNASNNLAHTDTTVMVTSSLGVVISATPNPVTAGTPLSYQITVSNGGPSTATGISLSDPLPAGVMFSSTGGAGACGYQTNTTTVTCQLPDLDPGQSEVVFVYTTVKPSTLGSLTNKVTATAPSSPDASGSVVTGVNTVADLGIVLASDLNVYKPSTTIHYQITVVNYGPSDARHVVISQALPSVKQGKYISNNIGCAPPVGNTLTCTDATVSALSDIPSGGSVTFQVNFYITGNKGTISSTASVTSVTTDPVSSNNSSTRVVTVK